MASDYQLERTVKPVLAPVTLDQVKTDLRLQYDNEDSLINSLIAAATDFMDVPNGLINKALITQTWVLSCSGFNENRIIDIPITPVQSIQSIQYYDVDDVLQTFDMANVYVYGDENSAWVEAKKAYAIPAFFDRRDAVIITFIAGFGDSPDAVPATINQAMRMTIGHWFDNRAAVSVGAGIVVTELPLAVQSLISVNKKGWVG